MHPLAWERRQLTSQARQLLQLPPHVVRAVTDHDVSHFAEWAVPSRGAEYHFDKVPDWPRVCSCARQLPRTKETRSRSHNCYQTNPSNPSRLASGAPGARGLCPTSCQRWAQATALCV